jgi:hypothetical protein
MKYLTDNIRDIKNFKISPLCIDGITTMLEINYIEQDFYIVSLHEMSADLIYVRNKLNRKPMYTFSLTEEEFPNLNTILKELKICRLHFPETDKQPCISNLLESPLQMCPVCLTEHQYHNLQVLQNCFHLVCLPCLNGILKSGNRSCPLCRTDLF